MNRRKFLIAAGSLPAFLVVACGGGGSEDRTDKSKASSGGDSAKAGGQLVIGSSEEPGNLNPPFGLPHHFPVHAPVTLIFDSLLQIQPDGSMKPRLAESWQVAPDNRSVTFKLNTKAKFHNGSPVTADDVAFTFKAMMDKTITTAKDGTGSIAAVDVIDPSTIKFSLTKVDPLFMPVAGTRGIVPKALLDGKNLEQDAFNKNPVGSGPFKFVSWRQGSEIVMEANKDYHLGAPKASRIVFKIVPDQNAVVAQVRTGDLDYGLIDPKDAKVVEGFKNVTLTEAKTTRYYSMGLNLRMPLFQDIAVRQALMYASPRDELVKNVLEGKGTVVNTNATPASWAYNDGVTKYSFDAQKAKDTLKAAGYTAGSDGIVAKDGRKVSFKVTYIASEKQSEQALVILQQRYKEAGIAITLEGVDSSELLSNRWPKGNFEAAFQLWNPVYDPDQNSTFRTAGTYNGTGYANPELDKLFDAELATFDQAERKKNFAQIQTILNRDLPMVFLYSNNEVHALSKRIKGLVVHPINIFWNANDWSVGS